MEKVPNVLIVGSLRWRRRVRNFLKYRYDLKIQTCKDMPLDISAWNYVFILNSRSTTFGAKVYDLDHNWRFDLDVPNILFKSDRTFVLQAKDKSISIIYRILPEQEANLREGSYRNIFQGSYQECISARNRFTSEWWSEMASYLAGKVFHWNWEYKNVN